VRIPYEPIRQLLLLLTPSMLMCVIPDWIGITQIKPDFQTFRFWFNSTVSFAFFTSCAFLIYALVHNANIERSK
jgi:hypothetical protein